MNTINYTKIHLVDVKFKLSKVNYSVTMYHLEEKE